MLTDKHGQKAAEVGERERETNKEQAIISTIYIIYIINVSQNTEFIKTIGSYYHG